MKYIKRQVTYTATKWEKFMDHPVVKMHTIDFQCPQCNRSYKIHGYVPGVKMQLVCPGDYVIENDLTGAIEVVNSKLFDVLYEVR